MILTVTTSHFFSQHSWISYPQIEVPSKMTCSHCKPAGGRDWVECEQPFLGQGGKELDGNERTAAQTLCQMCRQNLYGSIRFER
jgi:hypothetical protein